MMIKDTNIPDDHAERIKLIRLSIRNIFSTVDGDIVKQYLFEKYIQKPFCDPKDGFDKAGAEAIWRDGQRSVIEDLFKKMRENNE